MEELIKQLTGTTEEQAVSVLNKKGLRYRFVMIDGQACGVTDDFQAYRVNIELEKNLVTKISFG
jgi:hypothetical protein